MSENATSRNVFAAVSIALLAAALALTGCDANGGTDPDSPGGPGYGAPETTAEATAETARPAEPAVLSVADTSLGPVVADGEGFTLYLFTEDKGGVPSCYEQCAVNWPPLLTTEEATVQGDELDAELVSSVERTDGTFQVTYNDHPLYYWFDDHAAGDVNGQGVQDVWYVLDPEGEAVMTSA